MNMVAEIHIFDDLFNYVDQVAAVYIDNGASIIADSIQPLAHSFFIIAVTWYGYVLLHGKVSDPIAESAANIIKWAFFMTLATDSVTYGEIIVDALFNWPQYMAGALNGSGSTSTTNMIDDTLSTGLTLTSQAWQTASISNIGGYIIASILFVFTVAVTGIAAVIIIGSKITLTLNLTLGPLFILMMMFNATRRFFEQWISTCLTEGFTIVLASMAASLIFKFYAKTFEAAANSASASDGVVTLGAITAPTIVGIVAIFLLLRIPSVAGSLGGGVSASSANAAGWAYDKIRESGNRLRRNVGRKTVDTAKAFYSRAKNPGSQGHNNSIQGGRQRYRLITGQNRMNQAR
jgi:type IV secretion system protein VirB6